MQDQQRLSNLTVCLVFLVAQMGRICLADPSDRSSPLLKGVVSLPEFKEFVQVAILFLHVPNFGKALAKLALKSVTECARRAARFN